MQSAEGVDQRIWLAVRHTLIVTSLCQSAGQVPDESSLRRSPSNALFSRQGLLISRCRSASLRLRMRLGGEGSRRPRQHSHLRPVLRPRGESAHILRAAIAVWLGPQAAPSAGSPCRCKPSRRVAPFPWRPYTSEWYRGTRRLPRSQAKQPKRELRQVRGEPPLFQPREHASRVFSYAVRKVGGIRRDELQGVFIRR